MRAMLNFRNSGLNQNGKFVSKRFIQAKNEGKLTAGEGAKMITKQVGEKVLAKQLVEMYKFYFGFEPEWHHSGFFKSNGKGKMNKTYFFEEKEINAIIANYQKIKEGIAEQEKIKKEKENEMVYAIYWNWTTYYGYKGKKRYGKELKTFYGPRKDIPVPVKRVIICSEKHYLNAKKVEGKIYEGYDYPRLWEFEK